MNPTSALVSVLVLCHILADASSIRGAHKQQWRELFRADEPLLCRVTTNGVTYERDDMIKAFGVEEDVCIPIVDGRERHLILPISLPEGIRSEYALKVESGKLLVYITGAVIEGHELIISDDATYNVLDEIPDHLRHLSALSTTSIGTRTLMVVKVTTSDGVSSPFSLDELRQGMFGSGPGLKSQYEACSFGKLQFEDAGGLEVTLDSPISAFSAPSGLLNAALDKILAVQGVEANTLADHVAFCQPPGVGGWLAVSPVNGWHMNFNGAWCLSMSANLHEMGHNLGLIHSGVGSEQYADESGYMGYGSLNQTGPSKCFNGHKNWQLQWYSDRQVTVDPATPSKINLAAFVDYDKTQSDEPVLINIANMHYLQYNRAKLFNSETTQARDMVTIVEDDTAYSQRIGELDASSGQFTMSNYQGSGRQLVIDVCAQQDSSSGGADVMVVSIAYDASYCNQDLPSSSSGSGSSSSVTDAVSSSGSSSSSGSCKTLFDTCSQSSDCCDGTVCLLSAFSSQKLCRGCRYGGQTCDSTAECCGDAKCFQGACL